VLERLVRVLKPLADIVILKYVYDPEIQYDVVALSGGLSGHPRFAVALTGSEFCSRRHVGPKFDLRRPVNSRCSDENNYRVKQHVPYRSKLWENLDYVYKVLSVYSSHLDREQIKSRTAEMH
jgi:hypothetical protein